MEDLSVFFQLVESSHRLLKGRVDIRPVNEHKIDMIRLEISKRILDLLHNGIIAAVTSVCRAVDEHIAGLGGDENLVAHAESFKCPAQEFFGFAAVVGRSSIKKVNAFVDRGCDRVDLCFFIVIIPAYAAHSPGAEGHCGNLHACISEYFVTHRNLL